MRRHVGLVGLLGVWVLLSCAGGEDPFVFDYEKDGASGDGDAAPVDPTGGSGGEGDGGSGNEPAQGGWGNEPQGGNGNAPAQGGWGNEGGGIPSGCPDPSCTGQVKGPCNTLRQCGCCAGQACDVEFTDGSTNCFSTKFIPPSAPCEPGVPGLGSCTPGYTCVQGCKKYCMQPSDCPGNGAVCFQMNDKNNQPIPGMKVCTDHCEPWNPNSCTGGLACTAWDLSAKPGTFVCMNGGTNPNYCTQTQPCPHGSVCMEGNKCYKWCRVGYSDCSGSLKCNPLGVYWSMMELGVCA